MLVYVLYSNVHPLETWDSCLFLAALQSYYLRRCGTSVHKSEPPRRGPVLGQDVGQCTVINQKNKILKGDTIFECHTKTVE